MNKTIGEEKKTGIRLAMGCAWEIFGYAVGENSICTSIMWERLEKKKRVCLTTIWRCGGCFRGKIT